MARKHNFFAGPAVMPVPAIKQAQKDLYEFKDTGIGLAEISHRSKAFDDVVIETIARAKRLYKIPEDYSVLFVQGGASMVMAINALDFIPEGAVAQFIDSGRWSQRAIKEAKRSKGTADVIWSGEKHNYSKLPDVDQLKFKDDAAFVHITSNNTVAGSQFHKFPKTKAPLFVDASSDFFSKPLDISKFGMLYGGVQKNLGPSGSALVIIKKNLLERIPDGLSEMLDLRIYNKKNSMYNTPATFVIYMVGLTLKWLEEDIGGLDKMYALNLKKQALLNDLFDKYSDFYKPVISKKEDRSYMNMTFRLHDQELEAVLIKKATEAGFIGLKGHRSVGGLRASIYNSCPLESVQKLTAFLENFVHNH